VNQYIAEHLDRAGLTTDAHLIRENRHGLQLRYASDFRKTWPGYHATAALPQPGYWIGTDRHHQLLGMSEREALAEWDYRNQE